MGSSITEIEGPLTADATPADVAALYSWANLQGAKYRDYSAARREYRARARLGAAKALLERELAAQAGAEGAAEQAEREAFAAEAVARSKDERDSQGLRLELLRTAEASSRKAAAERVEAARRAESAARATMTALREEREIAEARASALQQAMVYSEAERRKRAMAGPQPKFAVGAEESFAGGRLELPSVGDPSVEFAPAAFETEPLISAAAENSQGIVLHADAGHLPERAAHEMAPLLDMEGESGTYAPAWFYGTSASQSAATRAIVPPGSLGEALGDTLQQSRERVASRWFTLKAILDSELAEFSPMPVLRPGETRVPVAALFSLAGGVGKTSVAAALARALAMEGEKVAVADASSQRVLPFYFGKGELKPGVRHLVAPPEGRTGEAIELTLWPADSADEALLAGDILRFAEGRERLLLELSSSASGLLQQMTNLHPTVLVPILPDMNSLIGLQAVEKLFQGVVDRAGRALLPFYLLNQFDVSLPLHLDVREVLRQKLGERLLPYTIRRSASVAEALAEGQTVLDDAPNSPVSGDYRDVAKWLKQVSPGSASVLRELSRGER